jgi:hypothetical protein
MPGALAGAALKAWRALKMPAGALRRLAVV